MGCNGSKSQATQPAKTDATLLKDPAAVKPEAVAQLSKKFSEASEEELRKAFAGLPADSKSKLTAALEGVKAQQEGVVQLAQTLPSATAEEVQKAVAALPEDVK